MLRRYAVAEIAYSLHPHARYPFGPLTLPVRFTDATSRVCSGTGSAGPLVIGRGPTHEVEHSGFLRGVDIEVARQRGDVS